jgi:cytochrome P450
VSEVFDPYAASSDDRYDAMARLRATSPVTPTPAGNYVATSAGVHEGLKHVESFVGSFVDTSGLAEDEVMISAIPEPRHGRIRRVINTVVAAHRTNQAEPFIRDLANQLVHRALIAAATEGTVDLVAQVVDPLPSAVIANVLGVPMEDHDRFRQWSDELLERQSKGTGESLSALHPEFADYIQRQIDQRRRQPTSPTTSSRGSSTPTSTASSCRTLRSEPRRCSSSSRGTRRPGT